MHPNVAKGILTKVSSDLGFPVMTLYLDEHTGKEGVRDAVGSFVDLISKKGKRTGGRLVNVFLGMNLGSSQRTI